MNPFNFIKNLEHHAYFIYSFKNTIESLKDFLKNKFNISHIKNPDFYHEKFETFGIDESRRIKEIHSSKSYKEGIKRIFIIECSNITHEAQNSLLKIFEEPNIDNHFFLIMSSPEILLSTLKSRLFIINNKEEGNSNEYLKEIERFLTLTKKEKVDYVDEISKNINDEKEGKSYAQNFLSMLELMIYKKSGIKNTRGLKAIVKAKEYINDRSPSIKQILEYVALNV